MRSAQAGLLQPVPSQACYLFFSLVHAERQALRHALQRLAVDADGVVDALFTFSKPVNGACFWCPPVRAGRFDLRQLGL